MTVNKRPFVVLDRTPKYNDVRLLSDSVMWYFILLVQVIITTKIVQDKKWDNSDCRIHPRQIHLECAHALFWWKRVTFAGWKTTSIRITATHRSGVTMVMAALENTKEQPSRSFNSCGYVIDWTLQVIGLIWRITTSVETEHRNSSVTLACSIFYLVSTVWARHGLNVIKWPWLVMWCYGPNKSS